MNNNRINFIGSTSHLSPRNTTTGECLRVVNLRQTNGTLASVNGHPIENILSEADRILLYVHTCNDRKHFISQKDKTLYHEFDISTSDNTKEIINKELLSINENLTSINAVGTTLIVTTATTIHYILHQESGYKILGTKPPIPVIRFNQKHVQNEGLHIESVTYSGKISLNNKTTLKEFSDTIMGAFYEIRESAYKKFNFFQPILIRYALRLYDGSHILPSPPVLLGSTSYEKITETQISKFSYNAVDDTSTLIYESLTFPVYALEYMIESCNLDNWRDIVTGIDVFVSKEINLIEDRDIDNGKASQPSNNIYTFTYTFPLVNASTVEKSVQNESLFYRLFSIDLDKIEIHTPIKAVHTIRPDNVIYQPRLKVDTSGFFELGAMKSYVYNGRLHLADITHKYYEGYPLNMFTITYDTEKSNAISYIRTTIKRPDNSNKTVQTYCSIPYFGNTLSPMLSYPDCNATSMEIVIQHDEYEYRKTFPLTSVYNENRASYLNPLLKNISVNEWERMEITTDDFENFPMWSEHFSYRSRNEMIVSELNNPFHFPSELFFSISKGIIAHIASTTIALSQGQYGEFPLYVFTNEGIWCMQQGEGEICYARCTLIDNICVDVNTPIITTEKNIIYRSNDNIMCLNGTESSVLLPLKELKQETFEQSLPSLLNNTRIAHTDNTSLLDFFQGDVSIGYIQRNNELVFYNPQYQYTLVIHLPTRHIYRSDCSIRGIVQDNDILYAQSHYNVIYNLGNEIDTTSLISLVTHPIQLIPDTYTRLHQIMLRMSCSNCDLKIAIVASHQPDNTYDNIYTAQYNGTISGQLDLKILAPAYKYYRIVISGGVSHDFILDYADVMFQPSQNNKLR